MSYGGPVSNVVMLSRIFQAFFLVLITRYLFRIREFGADNFALAHSGDFSIIHAFDTLLINKMLGTKLHLTAFIEEGQDNIFSRLMGFHPTIKKRKKALKNSRVLIDEVAGLAFVAGLVTGIMAADEQTADAINYLLIGLLVIGPPIIILLLNHPYTKHVSNFFSVLKCCTSFSSGGALTYFVMVVPSSIFFISPNDGIGRFRQAGDLNYVISFLLDCFLVLLCVSPFILTGLTLSEIFTRLINFREQEYRPKGLILIGWLMLLPGLVAALWALNNWWLGHLYTYNIFADFRFLIGWIVWLVLLAGLAKLIWKSSIRHDTSSQTS